MNWSVVIPVKRLPEAKSRLRTGTGTAAGSVAVESVVDLALAFALDTVIAALATPGVERVLVVSSDPTVARAVGELGAAVVADPGGGLNAAVGAGVTEARAVAPGAGVAVLTGDLPALRSVDLASALAAAGDRALAVVPDHLGSGTTLLTARPGEALDPRFGVDSLARHESAGHEMLGIPLESSLRWDVDTPSDLERAELHGPGPHTTRALSARRVPTPGG